MQMLLSLTQLRIFSARVVRMSSPMINNVIILGCFFCYVFVFLLGIDSRLVDDHVFGILCHVSFYFSHSTHSHVQLRPVLDVELLICWMEFLKLINYSWRKFKRNTHLISVLKLEEKCLKSRWRIWNVSGDSGAD